ncbi:MAG: protein-L-isoaspartate(D-aspartate) O-methyltransferase [Chitinivibrionales bacterium]|nr:protein-L-isoaspartate(D-aspartate) O-methyltransferase [Chitinivibrionales bacterium]
MNYARLKPEIAVERLIKNLRSKGISDERVLDAFRKTPRHLFVDAALQSQAYDDNALPIGFSVTISQPYVVALMTQLLELQGGEKILEIGTGSGFQAAILAQFTRRVYTIERHRELAEVTRKKLRALNYYNITFKTGDGTKGWPQHAPFDRIIVTAGAPTVPQALSQQLAVDGRMIIPAGSRASQTLDVFDKTEQGISKRSVGNVVFVPLIGENGWQENR